MYESIGKTLILFGGILAAIGILLIFANKIPYIGKLSGDINIKKENFQIYIPITTSILISILLSAVLWLISFFNKK